MKVRIVDQMVWSIAKYFLWNSFDIECLISYPERRDGTERFLYPRNMTIQENTNKNILIVMVDISEQSTDTKKVGMFILWQKYLTGELLVCNQNWMEKRWKRIVVT